MRLAFVITGKANVQVIGAIDHEISAFQLDNRRAAAGRFGVGLVGLPKHQPFGRIKQHGPFVRCQEPANRDGACRWPLIGPVKCNCDFHK
jgi:hypothetical protein